MKILGLKIQIGIHQGKPVKGSDIMEAEKKIYQVLDFLEAHLSKGSPYICGKRMTIADLLVFEETVKDSILLLTFFSHNCRSDSCKG